MALTNWNDILNKPKGIDDIEEIALEVSELSSSVLTIAGDVQELDLTVADLSASVLSVKAGVEALNTYQHTETTLTSGIVTEFGRMGNECILKFGDGSTNVEYAANSSLGTVPAGYEPIMALDLRDTGASKRIIVDTNGAITARESIPAGSFIRGSFTYIGKLPTQATRQAKKTIKKK